MLVRSLAARIGGGAHTLTWVYILRQMALPETSDVACLSTDGEQLYAVGHMHGIYIIDPRARRAAEKLRSVESQGVSPDSCFERMLL
jgi:hypothetical protein